MEEQFFIDNGSSFHSLGAAQENALSPCFLCVVGTVNIHVLVDLSVLVVGAPKSIYEMKCALLDKMVNFGTQIVEIFLYRNFDGSKLVRPVFSRHLGFQNGRHLGPIFSNISKRKTLFHERTLEVSKLT